MHRVVHHNVHYTHINIWSTYLVKTTHFQFLVHEYSQVFHCSDAADDYLYLYYILWNTYIIAHCDGLCCLDDKKENTVSPCNCVGSHAHVHVTCLEQWLSVSKSSTCDICSYTFKTIERSLTLYEVN